MARLRTSPREPLQDVIKTGAPPPPKGLLTYLDSNSVTQSDRTPIRQSLESALDRLSATECLIQVQSFFSQSQANSERLLATTWALWEISIERELWRPRFSSLNKFKEVCNYQYIFQQILFKHGIDKAASVRCVQGNLCQLCASTPLTVYSRESTGTSMITGIGSLIICSPNLYNRPQSLAVRSFELWSCL